MTNKLNIAPLHVGISVPDMEEAVRWYCDVLGCEKLSDKYLPALGSRVVFLRLGDFKIELFQNDEWRPLPENRRVPNEDIKVCGTKHICFGTDNMTELKKYFDEKKVDCATDVFQVNGHGVLFIRDVAGNLIEFIEDK